MLFIVVLALLGAALGSPACEDSATYTRNLTCVTRRQFFNELNTDLQVKSTKCFREINVEEGIAFVPATVSPRLCLNEWSQREAEREPSSSHTLLPPLPCPLPSTPTNTHSTAPSA